MRQIIAINPDDESADIRARIENAEFSQAVLVVPRDCRALESDSGMLLIRRAAEDAGVEVALVVRDSELRSRAQRVGLPTFNSIHKAQREQWRMQPLPKSRTNEADLLPDPRPLSQRIVPIIIQHRNALALLGTAILALCLGGLLLLPAARIRLIPAPVAVTINVEVSADPTISQVSSAQRWLPARRVAHEISGTARLATTTQKNIPDARSAGSVIFTNQRNEDTIIPQGAIVRTSGGVPIRFTIATTVTIPSGIGSRIEAPIQALDPGPSGNVKELTINTIDGTLNADARVINLRPTASGNFRNVRVVTADDKKKLEAQLTEQLQKQATSVLAAELKPTEFILADSIFIDANDVLYDHAVDEPADALNLRISGSAVGLAVDREDLDLLVRALVQKELQEGYALLPDGIKADVLPGGKYNYPAFRLPLRGVGYATVQIDTAKVARAVQGKSVQETRTFLSNSLPLAQPPEITTIPPGWFWMPWFNFRIAVFVDPQSVAAP